MNYEKKIREIINSNSEYYPSEDKAVFAKYFPELKESENERIRKEIIDFLRLPHPQFVGKRDHEKWLAWLEKQGEKKLTDEVEPKFKVGDFITNDYCLGKVIEITNDAYLLDTGQGIPFSCEHNAHLWTIKDAKDGDVLTVNNCVFIYAHKYANKMYSIAVAHCFIDSAGSFYLDGEFGYTEKGNSIHPATKEQRDLLFAKMKEAGYEWDNEKKELKKI